MSLSHTMFLCCDCPLLWQKGREKETWLAHVYLLHQTHCIWVLNVCTFYVYEFMWNFWVPIWFLFVNGLKLQFFYERLMRRKDDDCFCSSMDTKCWWHDLKDVKVTNSMKISENVDLKTMLDSLPRGKISFMLEF
jgi:hypothetical protein